MALFLIRYSEIGLKGPRKRSDMERILIRNLRSALSKIPGHEISREKGRLFLETSDSSESRVTEILGHIFGIKSFSPCRKIHFNDLQGLCAIAETYFKEMVSGKTFAVRARRTGKHSFTSLDVERELGRLLLPFSTGVNLKTPDFTAMIEVREHSAYLFQERRKGPGGFPLGSQGRMISLVSGGIDSPVATWMMMKRGCVPVLVFCSLADPIDTTEFLRSIRPLLDRWSFGSDLEVRIYDGRPLIDLMIHGEGFAHPNVGFKKFLYLLAERVCRETNSFGIITGESLGQVSSQTAENLYALSQAVSVPLHRPLIGFDKDDIVDLSKSIGTYPEHSLGEFCSIFSVNPSVSVTVEELSEDVVPVSILDGIMAAGRLLHSKDIDLYLDRMDKVRIGSPGFDTNALVVDLRTSEKYEMWHPAGAINASVAEVTELPEKYGKNRTYIFYCSSGLMSAYAASRLSEKGINAVYTDEKKMKKAIDLSAEMIKSDKSV